MRDVPARIIAVSLESPDADFAAAEVSFSAEGTEFALVEGGRPVARMHSPLFGLHNVRNALGAIALVRGLGLTPEEIARSLPRFSGIRRRLEVIGERNNISIVDDFAHHPTAVAGTLAAARTRWPGRRIWALFEPRSNTAGRKMFQDDYAQAFSSADLLVLAPVFHANRLTPETTLDRDALVARFSHEGKPGFAPKSIDEIPEILAGEVRPGDVVILMSSGAFGGLPQKLLCSNESEPP